MIEDEDHFAASAIASQPFFDQPTRLRFACLCRGLERCELSERARARTGAPVIGMNAVAPWPWADIEAIKEAEFEAMAFAGAASPARPSSSSHGILL